MTPQSRAEEIAAQCWCDPRVSDREMDAELCKVFAEAITQAVEEAVNELKEKKLVWVAGAIDKAIAEQKERDAKLAYSMNDCNGGQIATAIRGQK